MAEKSNRRTVIVIIVVLLLIALALLLMRCRPEKPPASPTTTLPAAPGSVPAATPSPAASASAASEPEEVLTPATIAAPARITAGSVFAITWTGPGNRGDYLTIVPVSAPAEAFTDYRETDKGQSLELTAPIEPGPHEVRYVTHRSHTILGHAPIDVAPAGATLDAAAEVILGSQFPVAWTGPDNRGDYITIVPKDWPDEKYANFASTEKGSPLALTAPAETGDLELRYVSGQGRKVLARRAIRVIPAEVTLSAPAEAIAGSTVEVAWKGPDNSGDYITVVPKEIPDGQYGNYTNTAAGSPLKLLMPIMAGEAELRYMTGQGNKVLGRRAIKVNAAVVMLSAPAEAAAGTDVSIAWTGPDNPGDYLTIVPKAAPDGQYAAYTVTSTGSPLKVMAPKEACEAEIRYMTGQGGTVLARIPIRIVP